jgi:Na+/H+ antiporter NhaD/arsenite permease-like protein
MIGSAVGLSFNDFVINLGPAVAFILPVTLIPIYLIWGRKLHTSSELRQRVMAYDEREAITDRALLWKSMVVLALVVTGFVFSHHINQQPATIAMFGAALLMLLDNLPRAFSDQASACHKTYSEVEWTTIFFFVGLFIVVYGVESTGLLDMLALEVLDLTGGDPTVTALSILWVSAVASAVVDNIPFVATMIPLIEGMTETMGGSEQLMPLWWSLALGSCLGGNGSLIGASANLIVAGFADRSGQPIRFLPFMLIAFPLMIFSIMLSSVYVYFRFLQ